MPPIFQKPGAESPGRHRFWAVWVDRLRMERRCRWVCRPVWDGHCFHRARRVSDLPKSHHWFRATESGALVSDPPRLKNGVSAFLPDHFPPGRVGHREDGPKTVRRCGLSGDGLLRRKREVFGYRTGRYCRFPVFVFRDVRNRIFAPVSKIWGAKIGLSRPKPIQKTGFAGFPTP